MPSPTLADLLALCRQLDGRGYREYRRLKGTYEADGFRLLIDHVQGDPFATPSRIRVIVPSLTAALPGWCLRDEARRTSTADFLNRALAEELARASRPRGTGKSGLMQIQRPGQQVLRRSSVSVGNDGGIEARFRAGLPAQGRRILGEEAASMFGEAVPSAVHRALRFAQLDGARLRRHVEVVEDAQALRAQLASAGLVAFVGAGAHLPRCSGVDDRPLASERVVPFSVPPERAVGFDTPNGGHVIGMGIPRGVTLIVGGGYHGKSTLLRAIERGVYDHIPGDGRERVVTVGDAMKIRAEDGRSVAGVDIANFIGALPDGSDTSRFVTQNASGSTSQASAIVEALEAGSSCLLLDEDTSATNFMIRDARMQALIAAAHEPITPLIDRIRELHAALDVSTLVVVGGAGDYFEVADTVVAMRDYQPSDVTLEAHAIASATPSGRQIEGGVWMPVAARWPDDASVSAARGRRARDIRVDSTRRTVFGGQDIDLQALEQLVEVGQNLAIAEVIAWGFERGNLERELPMADVITNLAARTTLQAWDEITEIPSGEFAAFRAQELAAFLNRVRTLQCRPSPPVSAS